MTSDILKKDHEALIRLHKAMTPEQRLVAFLNHSRLIHQLYRAGNALRKRLASSKTYPKKISA